MADSLYFGFRDNGSCYSSGSFNAQHLNWEEQKINGGDGIITHKVRGLLLTLQALKQLTKVGTTQSRD